MGIEKFSVIGPQDEKTRRTIEESLEGRREEAHKPFDGEREKTPEEIEIVAAVNYVLAVELQDFGLPFAELKLEQVHFVNSHLMHKYSGVGMGAANVEQGRILINTEQALAQVRKFTTLLHEGVHVAANDTVKLIPHPNPKILYRPYRLGYHLEDRKDPAFSEDPDKADQFFLLFNETVVDYGAFLLCDRYREELKEKFDIELPEYADKNADPQKWKLYSDFYNRYFNYSEDINNFLLPILHKVGKMKDEDDMAVFERFWQGQFTGEMMHLRDIEAAYGKNALRIIALMGAVQGEVGQELDEKISTYVKMQDDQDETERAELGEAILQEYKEYRESKKKQAS